MTGRSRSSSGRRWGTASTVATTALRSAPGTGLPNAAAANLAFLPRAELTAPKLADLLKLDDAAFREMFAGSPIKRIGRSRMIRNCLVAAGNSRDGDLASAVADHLSDPDPVIADAAAWAMNRLQERVQRSDAGRLRRIVAVGEPSIDVGDPLDVALQDKDRRRGHSSRATGASARALRAPAAPVVQVAAMASPAVRPIRPPGTEGAIGAGRDLSRRFRWLRGATGEQQSGDQGSKDTHVPVMAAASGRGKLAACGAHS